MNTNSQLLCLWSGPVMLLLFFLGFMVFAGYLPPPSAALSPDALVAMLRHKLMGFRIGMLITMVGFSFMVPWAAGLAARLRPLEGDFPVLTYTQIGSVAIGSMIGQGATWIFEAVAYRLDDTDPHIIRALHDVAFFTFLAPWPSFSVWCVALAVLIFRDHRPVPDFPRWAAYLSLWTAVLFVPACLIFWFKTGPFSWSGVISFYIPVFIFFIWVVGLTVPALRAVHRSAEASRQVIEKAGGDRAPQKTSVA